jgi:hypothetical protein
MSDNWIRLIPEDPHFVPDAARQRHAKARFAEIAPQADEISIEVFDDIVLFDCGANLERILCPTCRTELSINWWQDRMDDDFDQGFKLAKYPTPCCKTPLTLHELIYEWPQGFGRFVLVAMNPNVGELSEARRLEFEQILGTRLRIIYQHL